MLLIDWLCPDKVARGSSIVRSPSLSGTEKMCRLGRVVRQLYVVGAEAATTNSSSSPAKQQAKKNKHNQINFFLLKNISIF